MSNSLNLVPVDLPISAEKMSEYLEVVGFRLLIVPDRVKSTTTSGIITSTDYEDSDALRAAAVGRGIVVAIGPMSWKGIKGYDYDAGGDWCKVGDHVIFTKFSGKYMDDPVIRDPDDNTQALRIALVNDEDIQCKMKDELIAKLKKELYPND